MTGNAAADRRTLVVAVVAASLAVHVAHGVVHGLVPVPTTGWRLAFVVAFVFGGPVAGLALLRSGRRAVAGWMLALAGLGTVGFEVAYHFVLTTPDHVGNVTGPWGDGFVATAVLGVVLAAGMAIGGAWLVGDGGPGGPARGHSSRSGSPASESSR